MRLEAIEKLAEPGQEISLSQAIDKLADIYQLARQEQQHRASILAELERKRSVIPASAGSDYQDGLVDGLADAIKLLGGE